MQVSRGGEGDASRVAEELPAAELADVRVWRQRHSAECGRWQTHAGGRPRARGTFDKLVTDPSTSTLISRLPLRSAARRERRCHESCSGEVAPRLASDGCDGRKVLAEHRSTGAPRGGGRSAGPVGVHRWWNGASAAISLSPATRRRVAAALAPLMRCITPPTKDGERLRVRSCTVLQSPSFFPCL